MLTLSNITLRRGPRVLLRNLSVAVYPGWRVGVVGRNGSGKSSLFAMLLGELAPDEGEISLPRDLSIAAVEQETPATPQPAIEYVLDGDAELRALEQALARAERDGDAAGIARAHERLREIGGYAARARAGAMLFGLGFPSETHTRPVADFSGGWRMRLNLARSLMQRSDLLLLDEPTNHLDLDAVLWLERTLADFSGTLLVISHDRDFLDATTTHTLHLANGEGRLYSGNYSSFETQRAAQLASQAAAYEAQQRRIAHLQSFVDRFRAKASKARQAQARLKMIERMPKVAPVHAEAGFDFEFRTPRRLPAPLVRLDAVSVGYDGVPVLRGVKLSVAPGQRIGLLGANGAGKSTLIKLLAGELTPLEGEAQANPNVVVGYFAQHQIDALDLMRSPLEHVIGADPSLGEQAARDFLGGFAFRGDRVFEPVAQFSGGERARLALALLVQREPNLLLLDEPTNHLDLDMRHALEVALQSFEGAVVTVSHDRHLLRATCDELWLVADGSVAPFDGDLDDYARWLAARQSSAAASLGASESRNRAASPPAPSARDRRREAAEQRAREKPLRDALERIERELDAHRERLTEIERTLADPALYASGDAERLAALAKEQAEIKRRIEDVETRWLEAAEALEAARSGAAPVARSR
ncbi:MAG: ATP-binding cassette domain-containing protein [Gammaproteobacteria bacterium]